MSGERTRLSQRVLTMDDRETVPPWFIRHVTLIARIWGVLTVTVIWISAIFTLQRHYHKEKVSDEKLFVAWYFVGIGVVMVFLELVWLINKSACCRADGCCCAIWRIILWVDDWKRGVLYILFSIPAFLEGIGVYFSLISGFMLIVLGCLYITKTFRHGGYTMIREIRNTQYVESGVPKPKVITMEVTTQTDDDQYYGKLVERSDKPSAPPEQEPTR